MTRDQLNDSLEFVRAETAWDPALPASARTALDALFAALEQAAGADFSAPQTRARVTALRQAALTALGGKEPAGTTWAGALMRLSAEFLKGAG